MIMLLQLNDTEMEWQDFIDHGFLWLINMNLHVFGIAIAYQYDNEDKISVFPIKTDFRGFAEKTNETYYEKITDYIVENATSLKEDFYTQVEIEVDRNVKTILDILITAGVCTSKSEAKRLITCGLVYYNDESKEFGMFDPIIIGTGDTLKVRDMKYRFTLI